MSLYSLLHLWYTQHVSATSIPIIRSSRLYVCYCRLWCAVLGCWLSGSGKIKLSLSTSVCHIGDEHILSTCHHLWKTWTLMVFCGKLGFCMHYLISVRPIVATLGTYVITFHTRGRKFEYWEICLLLKKLCIECSKLSKLSSKV